MQLNLGFYASMGALIAYVAADPAIIPLDSCKTQHFVCPKSPRTVLDPRDYGQELVTWTWKDFKDYVSVGDENAYTCPEEVDCDSMPVTWVTRPDKFGRGVHGLTTLKYIWHKERDGDKNVKIYVGCTWAYTNFDTLLTTTPGRSRRDRRIYKRYDCYIKDNK